MLDFRDLLFDDVLVNWVDVDLIGHLDELFIVLTDDDLDASLACPKQDVVVILVFEGDFVSLFIQVAQLVAIGETLEDSREDRKELLEFLLVC